MTEIHIEFLFDLLTIQILVMKYRINYLEDLLNFDEGKMWCTIFPTKDVSTAFTLLNLLRDKYLKLYLIFEIPPVEM